MRALALLLLCLLGLGSLPGIALQPDLALRVTTGDGAPVACAHVAPGTPVTLEFTHSMFGGFVRERYIVTGDGQLERRHIVTEHPAAAEYYATDGRTRPAPEGHEVVAGPLVTAGLVVRVDQRGDHRLTIGARSIHLAGRVPGSTPVHIHTGRGCPP